MDDDDTIQCATHGPSYAAYICRHLWSDPEQEWVCDYPSKDNPWPDAWCAACNESYSREGEWNDENSGDVELKVLCSNCYGTLKGRSVAHLMEACKDTWEPLVAGAMAELQEKQKRLGDEFDLSNHERWDWDQSTGEIVFSNAGKPAVVASIQFVGSLSTASDTWMWSWANDSNEPSMYADILSVRDFGETRRFANLTVPLWPADEVDGWEMTAIAAKVLGAQGAYRTPKDNGFTFMVFTDIRRVH